MSPQMLLVLFVLFFLVANPKTYELTSDLIPVLDIQDENGPTYQGVLVHALVFVALAAGASKMRLPAKVGSMMKKSA